MRVKIKSRIFVVILMVMVIFPAICFLTENVKESSIDINIKNSSTEINSGVYDGGACIMGMRKNYLNESWEKKNQTTIINPNNTTIEEFTYSLNQLNIKTFNIHSGIGNYSIANNISGKEHIEGTIFPEGYRVAQEFNVSGTDFIYAIDEISLYLAPVVGVGVIEQLFYHIFLLNENLDFDDTLGYVKVPIRKTPLSQWYTFDMISGTVLDSNKNYNFVYLVANEAFTYIHYFKTWWLENKSITGDTERGLTRIFNGTDFESIQDDDTRDMLCNFTYKKIINPMSVDLKYYIDGEEIIPTYQISTLTLGYEAVSTYNFETPPNEEVNVTIVTNANVESLKILIIKSYVYTINALGSYEISDNNIEWTMKYPYYDIGVYGIELWFLFESDWVLNHFYNTLGTEIEVFIGPVNLYNTSYYGLFDLWGDPLGFGNCTGVFQSSNYCNNINSKIQEGSTFLDNGYLQLGKTAKIEAEITNALGEPISGGSGNLTLRNPSGEKIFHDSNLISYNGILSSSELFLELINAVGMYEIDVFWTNGKEIAYYTMQVEVRHPEGYIPPELIILILAIIGLSVCSVPIAIAAKKRVQRRNWEKTLHNLFVLSKDGVPLYDYTFGIEVKQIEMITGMISALTTFMKEATGSKKGVRIIDQQDKKIILNHGEHTTIAMVCEKDLPIIHNRIKKFSNEFESHYGKRLVNWSGETSMFKYTEKIITKYFPVSVEDQIIRGVRQKIIEFRERLKTIEDPKQIFSIMREITEFASRYHEIINVHSSKNYSELIKMAEEKINM